MAERRVLHLNLHREYFDRIRDGQKYVEYRERTDYWAARLEGREYDVVQFRNGYLADAPQITVEFEGIRKVIRQGRPHYAIQLGRVLGTRR